LFVISRENIKGILSKWTAIFAIDSIRDVFPIAGRAANMCNPVLYPPFNMLFNLVIGVGMPSGLPLLFACILSLLIAPYWN